MAAPVDPVPLPEDRTEALQAQIAQIRIKQNRLMDELTDGVDDADQATAAAYRRSIRERFGELERQRAKLQADLAAQATALQPSATAAELLEMLPELTTGLGAVSAEAQRELYDAFQLEIHYNRPRGEALLKVTINGATAEDLARRTKRLAYPDRVGPTRVRFFLSDGGAVDVSGGVVFSLR
ncbi:hypothetical protein [Actinacidiphila oryziradicis]|uniref:Uncharacterized protein n=1 Tax=Actinacidiphila oryziradicis TaxID=2571141 RepID=A0A4U0SB50_9ACTN|nr:hypothetical protein [Actinacidiphila oryziradicis]TKA04621.1 hypothetical protein FCI23_35215 [Actinacidiphila oryziradicis]